MMTTLARTAIVTAFLACAAPPALAADFTVTKTADTNDGVCAADCSLREAIVAANAQPGPDRVILGSGLTYTLTRGPADPAGAMIAGTGDLDVTDALTIDGHGSTIDAAGLDRVLDIEGSFTVTINDLTVKGGVASGFLSFGGGVYIKLTTVIFNHCSVLANGTAFESGARDNGGGIASVGAFDAASGSILLAALTLNNTSVSGNSGANGGGLLCLHCQLTMTNSSISGNVSTGGDGAGAALFGHGSEAAVTGGAFTGNTGAARGGAVAIPYSERAGIRISRTRIVSNAAAIGGAIFNNASGRTVTADNNWWGCNGGPGAGAQGCAGVANGVSGAVTTAPFLVLRATPAPGNILPPGQSLFTADLTFNSANADTASGGTIEDGVIAAFSSTLGTFSQPDGGTSAGRASAVFTAGNTSGSATLSATVDDQTVSATVSIAPPVLPYHARADLDADGLSDLTVWRAPTGTWFGLRSSSGYGAATALAQQWGNQAAGDVPFLTDIDGDGAADLVLWRASTGTWFWLTSSTGYSYAFAGARQWGNASLGDVPLVADLDGDARADLAVWRASTGTFYWLTSTTGYNVASARSKPWGNQSLGDRPMLADIDGDARADLAVWRASTGTWFWLTSSSNYASGGGVQWGNQSLGDTPFFGDMDGDGRADVVLWRASTATWFWLTSSSGYSYAAAGAKQWGAQALGDVPMVGDLDGDGKADLVVWRATTGTWFWLTSMSGYDYAAAGRRQWGSQAAGDVPMIR